MMIDFEEEKGLFTFYREQAELEQELKLQEKMLILKKRRILPDISEERDKSKLEAVRSQEISRHRTGHGTGLHIPKNRHKINPLSKRSPDNSVIIVRSGESKISRPSLEKKSLSMMMFDPKLREANKNEFFVPKSEFTFKNSHAIAVNQMSSLELRLSDLDLKHLNDQTPLLKSNSHRYEKMKIKLNKLKKDKQILQGKRIRTERFTQSPNVARLPCDLPAIKEKKSITNRKLRAYPLIEKTQIPGIVKDLQDRLNYENLHMRKHRFFDSQSNGKGRPQPTKISGIIDFDNPVSNDNDNAKLLEVLKKFRIGNTQIDLKTRELSRNQY